MSADATHRRGGLGDPVEGAEGGPAPASEAPRWSELRFLPAIDRLLGDLEVVAASEDLQAALVRGLRAALGAPAVVLLTPRGSAPELVVEHWSASAAAVAYLASVGGTDLAGCRYPVARAVWERLGRATASAGLAFADPVTAADGTPPLALALERLSGAPRLASLGLRDGDELLGVLALATAPAAPLLDDVHLRAIARASSGALRRWRAERERAALEDRLGVLMEGVRGVLWSTTSALAITRVSPGVERLLGYSPRELEGRSWLALLRPAARGAPPDPLRALMDAAGADRVGPCELPLQHRDGSVIWSEMTALRLRGARGEITGVQGILRDVSGRKRSEVERVELTEQLHQAMKMEAIGRLAGGIAHEFNNLLMGILGNLELVLGELPTEHPGIDALADAQLAAESAAALTRQLLGFSRRQMIRPELVDLNAVVGSLRSMVSRLIGEDVKVEWFLEPDVGTVRIDPGQLEQVLVNLLVNSRDALPRGGTIGVFTRRVRFDEPGTDRPPAAERGEYLLLRVVDDGIGMDESTRERIFEPFFTTKPAGRGTGLGLATTYGAVRQAGGFIEVESAPGRGASFSVYLPADDGPSPIARPSPSPVGERVTVLLVEDDPVVRGVTLRVLERLGYAVLPAGSGEEALSLASATSSRIDLLMTDLVMPIMSGVALAERITALRPGTRVLFTSGQAADGISRGEGAGDGWAFLAKPFTPRGLAERIQALLRQGDPSGSIDGRPEGSPSWGAGDPQAARVEPPG